MALCKLFEGFEGAAMSIVAVLWPASRYMYDVTTFHSACQSVPDWGQLYLCGDMLFYMMATCMEAICHSGFKE